ncbi:MAG: 3-oxoacyl-ACP synthase [Cyclobacteriaceae bacterium]
MEAKTAEKIKSDLLAACQIYVERRVSTAREAMEAAQQAANSEAKSSAGDKYTTTRAMMHQEREKSATQLAQALDLRRVLEQLQPSIGGDSVAFGSLVITTQGNFYISIPAGKIRVGRKDYFAISANSPIGAQLSGLKVKDNVTFNEKKYRIKEII